MGGMRSLSGRVAAATAVLVPGALVGIPSPAQAEDLLPFIYAESSGGKRHQTALPTVVKGVLGQGVLPPARVDTNADGVADMTVGYTLDSLVFDRFTVRFSRLQDKAGKFLATGDVVELVVPLPLDMKVMDRFENVYVGLSRALNGEIPASLTAEVGTKAAASAMSRSHTGVAGMQKSDLAVEIAATHPTTVGTYTVRAGAFNGPTGAARTARKDPLIASLRFTGKVPNSVFLGTFKDKATDTTQAVISTNAGSNAYGTLGFSDQMEHIKAAVGYYGPKAISFSLQNGQDVKATYLADRVAEVVHPQVVVDEHVDPTTKEKKQRLQLDLKFSKVPRFVHFKKPADGSVRAYGKEIAQLAQPFEYTEIGKVEGLVMLGSPSSFGQLPTPDTPYLILARKEYSDGTEEMRARMKVLGLKELSVKPKPLTASVKFGPSAFANPLRIISNSWKATGGPMTTIDTTVKNLPESLTLGPVYDEDTGYKGKPIDFYTLLATSAKNAAGSTNGKRPAADIAIKNGDLDAVFRLRDIPQNVKVCFHQGITCSRSTSDSNKVSNENDWGDKRLNGKYFARVVFQRIVKMSLLLGASADAEKTPLKISSFAVCDKPNPDFEYWRNDLTCWAKSKSGKVKTFERDPLVKGKWFRTSGIQLAMGTGNYCAPGSHKVLLNDLHGVMIHAPRQPGFMFENMFIQPARTKPDPSGCQDWSHNKPARIRMTGHEWSWANGYGTFLDLTGNWPTDPMSPDHVGWAECHGFDLRVEELPAELFNGAALLDGC